MCVHRGSVGREWAADDCAALQTVPLTQIDADVVKAVCNEYKIASADVAFRCDGTVDDLIE